MSTTRITAPAAGCGFAGTDSGGTLAPAGYVSRTGKFLMGAAQIFFLVRIVPNFSHFVAGAIPQVPIYWAMAIFSFATLSWTINLGFNRRWGKRPFYIATGMLLALGVGGLVATGAIWTPALAVWIFAVTFYVNAHMGFCHILAAFIATPGCEMRAIDHAKSMITGGSAHTEVCPGFWSNIDNWEARRRSVQP